MAYVFKDMFNFVPSEFYTPQVCHCARHCCMGNLSMQFLFTPSRSVSRAGEQEGVSSTEPLPPPLMSSTTGTGQREGDGNVAGVG